MRVRAYAKINLSLRVLGTRPDGYHELRTVFQSLALHDTLTIEFRGEGAPGEDPSGPFRLTCDDPECPRDRGNLVWRAAAAVWKAARDRRRSRSNLSIHLRKRIPMNAGFGGGSSDAASVIRALGDRWGVSAERQQAIAATLGADVPYFLQGGTVLGLERGDLLFPLPDHAPAWVVLAIPPCGVDTRAAFSWFDARRSGRPGRADAVINDLEKVVSRRHPEIARLVRALARAGATQAAMSGSGSGVFGLFAERTAAVRAASALGGSRVILTRTIGRRAYRRLAGN